MTYKQQLAINKVVENGGNVSKAMRDAGYSKNTAKTPSKLTDSKSWNEYIDIFLPDEMLLNALHDDIQLNKGNRKGLLELAFKLRGKFNDSNNSGNGHIVFGRLIKEQREKYFGD